MTEGKSPSPSLKTATYAMENEKDINISVKEVNYSMKFNPKRVETSQGGPSSAPWSSQPKQLKETKLTKWVNIVYDVGMCVAPLVLSAKVGLVFIANNMENGNTARGAAASVANPPSKLTTHLVDFNSQVSLHLYNAMLQPFT
jgi:hypothetical protein